MATHNLNSPSGRLSFAQTYLPPPVSQAKADAYTAEYREQVEQQGTYPPIARKEAKDKVKQL